jgi:hypothetical protein
MELLKNINIVSQINPLATAASDSTSSTVVDMAGYEGVCFFSVVGKSTAGSTGGAYQLKVKYSDSTGSTTFSDFTDAKAGETSGVTTGYIGDVVAVDVYKPVNRYLKASLNRGTKSVASGGVFAVQYGPRVASVTQSTNYVLDSASFTSPSS